MKTITYVISAALCFSVLAYGAIGLAQQRYAAPGENRDTVVHGTGGNFTREDSRALAARYDRQVKQAEAREVRIVESLGLSPEQMRQYQALNHTLQAKNTALRKMKSGHFAAGQEINAWWR